MVLGRKLGAQSGNGVDGVVRATVVAGRVDEGDFHAGLAFDREARHGKAIGEAGLSPAARARRGPRGTGTVTLQGLRADRGKKHAIEAEALPGKARKRQVAAMRRIEAAPKQADPHCF